jgi:hypothetical protein
LVTARQSLRELVLRELVLVDGERRGFEES